MVGANDGAEEAARRVGTVFKGKWRLHRLIGVGGTAAVYEARHRNGSRVAVKVLHERVARSKEQLARFHREGSTANCVGHPGVTIVHDEDVDVDGSPFLVMDLLQGQTVAERAAACGGVLDTAEVLDIADRLLDVLIAAHEKDIVHRDIKPQNLFLTNAGELKVLDFGIARLRDHGFDATSTEVGTVLGTPAFLPPEQARGRPDEIDARSDLWAVGATMYTLLTGRFVHDAPSRNTQLGLAMMTAAPSLALASPELPKGLVLLVDRALAFSRDDRWPDARTMQGAVRWLREHRPERGEPALELPASWTVSSTPSPFSAPNLTTLDPVLSHHEPPRRPWAAALLLGAAVIAGVLFAHRATPVPAALIRERTLHLDDAIRDARSVVGRAPTQSESLRPQAPSNAADGGASVVRRELPSSGTQPRPTRAPVARAAVVAPVPPPAAADSIEPVKRRKAVPDLDRRY